MRLLRSKLVVLVFVTNDFIDNFPLWTSLGHGVDPEHLPYVSAASAEDGSFRLRPPDPESRRYRLPRPSDSGPPATPRRKTRVERALPSSTRAASSSVRAQSCATHTGNVTATGGRRKPCWNT